MYLAFQIYTETLLHSGRRENVLLAGQMICKNTREEDYPPSEDPARGPRVKFLRASELVLEAAKEYFNSSADLSDSVMDLARLDVKKNRSEECLFVKIKQILNEMARV